MVDTRKELRDAVEEAIRNLKPIADRNPQTPVGADVFDMLLGRAKQLFPDSEIIKGLQPVESGSTVTDLMLRLSPLAGAISSALKIAPAAAMGRMGSRGRGPLGR